MEAIKLTEKLEGTAGDYLVIDEGSPVIVSEKIYNLLNGKKVDAPFKLKPSPAPKEVKFTEHTMTVLKTLYDVGEGLTGVEISEFLRNDQCNGGGWVTGALHKPMKYGFVTRRKLTRKGTKNNMRKQWVFFLTGKGNDHMKRAAACGKYS